MNERPAVVTLHPKRDNKPKLSYCDQIQYLKNKGITFNTMSDRDAMDYLENRNNYFKLTSYRSNFNKIDGIYQNLEFAYLVDLANIDAQLRRFIITTSLNTEHAMKVALLRYITKDSHEDGYEIVDAFKHNRRPAFDQAINFLSQSQYSSDLYNKHHNDPSVWVLLEILSFGGLGQFVEFYRTRNQSKTITVYSKIFKFAKNLRNAAAHSNPLLVNLFTDREFIPRPTPEIVSFGKMMGIDRGYLQDSKINDLVALFVMTKSLNSKEAISHISQQATNVLNRFDKHADYYANVPSVQQFKKLFSKMIDYLNS